MPSAATTSGSPSISMHTARASSPNAAASGVALVDAVDGDVHDDEDRLVREEEDRRRAAPARRRSAPSGRSARRRRATPPPAERRDLGGERLVALRCPLLLVEPLLDRREVGEHELVLEGREVVGRDRCRRRPGPRTAPRRSRATTRGAGSRVPCPPRPTGPGASRSRRSRGRPSSTPTSPRAGRAGRRGACTAPSPAPRHRRRRGR